MSLEWLKYFDKYIKNWRKGKYRILILDRYKSYKSIAFQIYYKKNDIIYLYLLLYSSYLTQLFDIDCFSNLKCLYSNQIDGFIKVYINYISKIEFFIAFKTIYKESIISQNIKAGFRGTGLVLFNSKAVFSKLDIRICISIPSFFDLDQ